MLALLVTFVICVYSVGHQQGVSAALEEWEIEVREHDRQLTVGNWESGRDPGVGLPTKEDWSFGRKLASALGGDDVYVFFDDLGDAFTTTGALIKRAPAVAFTVGSVWYGPRVLEAAGSLSVTAAGAVMGALLAASSLRFALGC